MTLRERLYAHIDELPETELGKLAKQLIGEEALEQAEQDNLAETIALWEAFAEPIEDEQAKRELAEAVKRRFFFGKRDFPQAFVAMMNRTPKPDDLSDEEALELATEEVEAHRQERRR